MKVLIVTQAVDRTHPVLGFFHRWIEEFAAQCGRVTVIAQHTGDVSLPDNAFVWSLGKERGATKLEQILWFWRLCLREEYDVVLVHMTPVWVLLGMPIWLMRPPVYLWYEVRRGGWVLRTALLFVRAVFSATVHGLPWPSKKQRVVGHGIDTALFHPPSVPRDPHVLLAVGRITRIKRLETIIACLAGLPREFCLRVIGPVVTEDDRLYRQELDRLMATHDLTERVTFATTDQQGVADAMRQCRMLLHGAGGGLDKALLEAMSCECPVVSCSEAGADVLPKACSTVPESMAAAVHAALADGHLETPAMLRGMRATVERDHGLPRLVARLLAGMGG